MRRLSNYLLLAMTIFVLSKCAVPKQEEKEEAIMSASIEVLAGTYTGKGSDGVYLLSFDPTNGTLENKGLVAETKNPSYLTISKDRNRVFVVNETENGGVSSFEWNEDRSKLTLISQQPSQGDYPCYTELNEAENLFAIGNYMTGNMLIYNVDSAGAIQPSPVVKQHEGSGPFLPNQESAHAHCAKFSPDGKFFYAVDLGIDKIIAYPVNDGIIGDGATALASDPGDGPRHMIFHQAKDMAFIINELSSSVVSVSIDTETGLFTPISKVSTLPEGYTDKNACADIHLSKDGKFLYASNRGHNSIAIFSVSETGMLEQIATESVQGNWPRNFALSPDNNHLLVANKVSNNITVFERSSDTGLLKFTGNQIEMSQPICLKF